MIQEDEKTPMSIIPGVNGQDWLFNTLLSEWNLSLSMEITDNNMTGK